MSFTLWFTGLSGAGKTTLSRKVYFELRHRSLRGELLDGDIIRANFSQELGFSKRDRDINVRRMGFLSHLLNKHGVLSVVAAIAPYSEARASNRSLIDNYVEIFVNCPLEVVERRDVKGLYKRAKAGEIPNFTGISDPYEHPENPEIEVRTDQESIDESVDKILDYLEQNGFIPLKSECELCPDAEEQERKWRSRLEELGFSGKK